MNTLPEIEVVSAGAGSGKTYRIKESVGAWVAAGSVRPEKIVAVTFTEAAAAELRERLRAELVDAGMMEGALRLDQAFISTIHGFGLRLITEFAFEAGLPPACRLLEEDEEGALIRQAIARAGDVGPITQNLARFGYRWTPGPNRSAEDKFRAQVRKMIDRLRAARQNQSADIFSDFAREFLEQRYGETIDGEAAFKRLHRAVLALLDTFPNDFSARYRDVPSAAKAFRADYRNLIQARDGQNLERNWGLWQNLRCLRLGNQRTAAPEGYDGLAEAVKSAADALPGHPGPLEDAGAHADLLIRASMRAIDEYRSAKRKFALVDYTDMIALACALLSRNTRVLAALRDKVDCLVIDEFQDTNPLQFSLLWLLREAGVPTLIVGDIKQAIMGFQGADPRLMEALLTDQGAHLDQLSENWRSQPGLMTFINAVGEGLFPGKYGNLEPRASRGYQEPLEFIVHPKPAQGRSNAKLRALWIADRVAELLGDDTQFVRDTRTDKKRRLRAGDIAVLCPTHKHLVQYADAFRQLGLKTRLREDGWHESRIVEIARYALEFATDPSDRHAALYLSVTEFGSLSLEEACRALIDTHGIDDPILDQLVALNLPDGDMTVDQQLARVISRLRLYEKIARWPDARQARADLLRLQGEATMFVGAKPETLASGGLYGSSSRTFLAWLDRKLETGENEDRRPAAEAADADAVEFVTWHASKGREWPVVVVCGWERKIEARLPDLSLAYEDFTDLGKVLKNARLTFVPQFAAPEARKRYTDVLMEERIETEKRLIYVVLTRARERLIMEWHAHLANSKAFSLHSLFTETLGAQVGDGEVYLGDITVPCRVTRNDGGDLNPGQGGTEEPERMILGRSLLSPRPIKEKRELFATPSSHAASSNAPRPEIYRIGPALSFAGIGTGAEVGTLVHRAVEILLHRPSAAESLSKVLGVKWSAEELAGLDGSVTALREWITKEWQSISLACEHPFVVGDGSGGVLTGKIDLLVSTEHGCWIVDHKTDQMGASEELFDQYWPQLESYAQAMQQSGIDVLGVALNHLPTGKMILSRFENI